MTASAARPRTAVRRRRPWRALPAELRALAALEFALVMPIILLMFGAAAEIGLGVWARGALADAVSQGAYEAFVTYAATGTIQPSSIQSLVQTASVLAGVSATVTSPGRYCAASSGATVTLSARPPPPAKSVCPDGTTPGSYTTISASDTVASFLPAFTGLGAMQLQDSVTVRLQ